MILRSGREGLETGLSLIVNDNSPVWVTGGLGGMGSFPLLDGIDALTIFADNDGGELHGQYKKLKQTYSRREVTFHIPKQKNMDANDIHRNLNHD